MTAAAIYKTMSDQELLDDIAAYRSIRRQLLTPGTQVAVVAGEGRRLEFTQVNGNQATTELTNLLAEAQVRGLVPADDSGGAINVEFTG